MIYPFCCDLETLQGSFFVMEYNGIQYNHNVKEALYILELYQHQQDR